MMNAKWHKRYLELAKHVSEWSKDSTKVGAVIVDPKTKKVVSMGYNGFPRGVLDKPERYEDKEIKYQFVCHAEVNAVLNAERPVTGCSIYVYPTMMEPAACPNCAKVLAQAGVKMVYAYEGKDLNPKWQDLSKYSETILRESGMLYIRVPSDG